MITVRNLILVMVRIAVSTKPTYDELQYQLAVVHAGYKDLKKDKEEVEEQLIQCQDTLIHIITVATNPLPKISETITEGDK